MDSKSCAYKLNNIFISRFKLVLEIINANDFFDQQDIKGAYNIAMCIEGKQLSSEKLSKKLSECGLNGFSTVNFIIGSSFGIAPEIKAKADLRLSMSEMTFPHQLARIMLLEQVYRAFQINANTRYHK